jgi:hypothetical protein
MSMHIKSNNKKLVVCRWVGLVLAVGLPILFSVLALCEGVRLRAMQTRGVTTTGEVTHINVKRGSRFVHYRYTVNGMPYVWNEDATRVTARPGDKIKVVYLPESPGRPWAGPALTEAVIQQETEPLWYGAGVTLALFGLAVGLNEVQIRRRRGVNADAPLTPMYGPKVGGALIFGAMLAVVIGVQFDPNVAAVMVKAFGPHPLGFPNQVVMIVGSVLLMVPFFWVFRHMAIIMMMRSSKGQRPTAMHLVLVMFGAGGSNPELARSRTILFLGLAYFIALVALWISHTSRLGI